MCETLTEHSSSRGICHDDAIYELFHNIISDFSFTIQKYLIWLARYDDPR